jgi:small subunit ribosomal protein S16
VKNASSFRFQLPAQEADEETGWELVARKLGVEMLAIRLRRTGSKKRPFFRVVVTDARAARDSSFVEVLGYYNPRTKPETLELKRDRLDHWIKAGAVPSDTVRTLVARMPPAPAEPAAAPTAS